LLGEAGLLAGRGYADDHGSAGLELDVAFGAEEDAGDAGETRVLLARGVIGEQDAGGCGGGDVDAPFCATTVPGAGGAPAGACDAAVGVAGEAAGLPVREAAAAEEVPAD
jgi:hypothetical protein